jgi:hypothetical protein
MRRVRLWLLNGLVFEVYPRPIQKLLLLLNCQFLPILLDQRKGIVDLMRAWFGWSPLLYLLGGYVL